MELIEKTNRNQHVFRIAYKNEIYEIHRSRDTVSDTWDVFNEESDHVHDVLPRRTADELHEKLREFALNLLTEQQETLEEAVENKFGKVNPTLGKSDYRMGFESGLVKGAKWQQERSYSEEDILGAFEAGMMFIGEDKGSFKEWFEQFKKK
jgi:hypothetical protein